MKLFPETFQDAAKELKKRPKICLKGLGLVLVFQKFGFLLGSLVKSKGSKY